MQPGREFLSVVFWLSLILLVLFGSFIVSYGKYAFLKLTSETPSADNYLVLFGFLMFFSVAFGITAAFFVKWHKQWIAQQAAEELKLRRLYLDFDQLSLAVEMALAWKDDNGGGLPKALLDKLAGNFFADRE